MYIIPLSLETLLTSACKFISRMFEKQLQCAHDTIAELKEKLRENKKNAKTVKDKATKKVKVRQE